MTRQAESGVRGRGQLMERAILRWVDEGWVRFGGRRGGVWSVCGLHYLGILGVFPERQAHRAPGTRGEGGCSTCVCVVAHRSAACLALCSCALSSTSRSIVFTPDPVPMTSCNNRKPAGEFRR